MKRVDDLDVAGRAVLLRADLNVPLDGAVITDDRRIRASLPTLTALTGRGARVVVCAHLGRPRGSEYAARAAGGPSLAPVVVGMMFCAAARARRRSLCMKSRMTWSLV